MALGRPFKEQYRELQQQSEYDQMIAGATYFKATRVEVIRRIAGSYEHAVEAIDREKVSKGIGATLALDGSEDHMLNSNLRDAWEEGGVAEWGKRFLDDHTPGTCAPRALTQRLNEL